MSTEFSGNDSDFVEAWRLLTFGAGTYAPKKLPVANATPSIPQRTGESGRIVSAGQASGSSGDMVLAGAKLFTSTDGMLVLSFPESAEVVIGTTTITIPAIIKT